MKKNHYDGTHRICPPADTVARLLPLLQRFGITRVANVTGLDWIGLPVVMVVRPNSRSLAVAQGKGVTLDAARASGLMEAVELYHAEHIEAPLLLASFDELRPRRSTVDVRGLPASSAGSFDAGQRLLWIEGVELMNDTATWVPLEVVSVDATGPELPGAGAFTSTSNGLASGNHRLEAVCHGLCEAIERDATTLFYLRDRASKQAARLDLASVDDPQAVTVLDRFDAARMDVFVWDVTSDIGVPAFLCLLTERDERPARARYASTGMGCHPNRAVALTRALTEAAQSRLTLIAGARDDVFRDEYGDAGYRASDVEYYRDLRPDCGAWRRFSDVDQFSADTFDADLAWLLERLRSAGFASAAAVDLTRPDLDIAVVRVVVPGLEGPGQAADYAPGARARHLGARAS